MSFLDNWKEKRVAKKIAKNSQYLSNKTSSRDGRYAAIEELKEIGSIEAIEGLLQRFRLTTPELTQDEEEKDYVSEYIRSKRKEAVDPLKEFIKRYDQVMRPLRLLSSILSEEEMVSFLRERINEVGELFSESQTIKLVEMLRHLAKYHTNDLVDIALEYIRPGENDEVIVAAVEILENQNDEKSRIPLLELAVHEETTQRITFRIGDLIEKLQWNIKGFPERKQLEDKLKGEFRILKGGFIKRKMEELYS